MTVKDNNSKKMLMPWWCGRDNWKCLENLNTLVMWVSEKNLASVANTLVVCSWEAIFTKSGDTLVAWSWKIKIYKKTPTQTMIVLLYKTKFEEYVNILALWLQKLLIKNDTDSMILWSWSKKLKNPENHGHPELMNYWGCLRVIDNI